MKNIIFCGTGGFAREVYCWVKQSEKKQKIKFKGFLDKNSTLLKKFNLTKYYLGSENNYSFKKNDFIVIAIADVNLRKKIFDKLNLKKINLFNYIHDTAIIGNNVIFGRGNIICPNVVFTTNIKIGNSNIFNINSTVGHEVKIDSFNTFNSHCDITGCSTIKKNNYFGSSVILLPKCKVGNNNKISAGSVGYKGIKENSVYLGNPAKYLGKNKI